MIVSTIVEPLGAVCVHADLRSSLVMHVKRKMGTAVVGDDSPRGLFLHCC